MIRARIGSLSELEAEILRRAASVPKAVAEEGALIIRENSAAGKDIKGQKMAPYSEQYKAFRAKHGLPTEPVDLRKEGTLLDKMTTTATNAANSKSSIEPAPERMIVAEAIMKSRLFYPVTDSDILPYFTDRLAIAGEKVMNERS